MLRRKIFTGPVWRRNKDLIRRMKKPLAGPAGRFRLPTSAAAATMPPLPRNLKLKKE